MNRSISIPSKQFAIAFTTHYIICAINDFVHFNIFGEESNLLSSTDEEMLSNIADREQADAQRNQILGLKRNLVSSQTYLKKLVAENTNILTKLAVLSENNRKLQHKK